jgi:hypothetical protein
MAKNLIQFKSVCEIEEFCLQGKDEDEYRARLYYTKDYLWGFTREDTDLKGYDLHPPAPDDYPAIEDRFFGMWIPGNGLNHNLNPNTVYRTRKGGTDKGICLVAISDIQAGEELFDDYRRHGRATRWLLDFAKSKQVTLNFAGCNDFVTTDIDNNR